MTTVGVDRLLAELVAIESVSGNEAALADFVAAWLTARGIENERLDNSLVARLARRTGPRLLLNSHLDTVPVGAGWTREPFAARWDGERLFGRGANDAKASVAAMLTAFDELARRPAQIAGEVLLALTACEETSNAGMQRVIEHLGLPDGGITGEPTGLEVVRAQSGLAVLNAEWHGKSCHAAHVARVEHVNALHDAARELAELGPWLTLEGAHPLLGASTVALTMLHAGERHNVVPDRALATFDGRLAPPHEAAEVADLLARKLANARISVRSARLRPIETAAEHPLVRAALACAGKPRAVGSSTLSDMALLQGVPCVKCGPGETARSHTPDEFVLRSEVEAGAAFYATVVPASLEALATAAIR